VDAGEIRVGLPGELVVVKGDPLEHIHVVERPEVVIQGGRIVH
jgi:imidazolonepropionase-like amidohydrolase